MEEKGAFFRGTLRFFCFVASFKKGVTLRFADYKKHYFYIEEKQHLNTYALSCEKTKNA